MAKQFLSLIKFRRGTRAERQQVIFEEGEPLYETDSRRMYIGTGDVEGQEGDPRVSSSSIPVGNLSFAGSPDASVTEDNWETTWYSDTAEENDTLYHKGRIYFWKKDTDGFKWTEALQVDNDTLSFNGQDNLHVNAENIVSVTGVNPITVTSSKSGEKLNFTISLGINENFFTTDASGNLIIKENSITNNLINWSSVNLLANNILDSRYFGTNSAGQAIIINVPAGSPSDTIAQDLDGKPIGSVNAIISDRFKNSPDFVVDDNNNIRVSAQVGVNVSDFYGVNDTGDVNSGYNGSVIGYVNELEAPRSEVTVYSCNQNGISSTPTNTLKSAGFIKIAGGTVTKQDGTVITYPDIAVPSFSITGYQPEAPTEDDYDTANITQNTSIITSIMPTGKAGSEINVGSTRFASYETAVDYPGPIRVNGINLVKDISGTATVDDGTSSARRKLIIETSVTPAETWYLYRQDTGNFDISDYKLSFIASENKAATPASIFVPIGLLQRTAPYAEGTPAKFNVVYGFNSAGSPLVFSFTISMGATVENFESQLRASAGAYLAITYWSGVGVHITTRATGYAAGKGLKTSIQTTTGVEIPSTVAYFTPGTDAISIGQRITYHPIVPATWGTLSPWTGYPKYEVNRVPGFTQCTPATGSSEQKTLSQGTYNCIITLARQNGLQIVNRNKSGIAFDDIGTTVSEMLDTELAKFRISGILNISGENVSLDITSSNTQMPSVLNGATVTVTLTNTAAGSQPVTLSATLANGVDGHYNTGDKADFATFLNEDITFGGIHFADDRDTDTTYYANTSMPKIAGIWILEKGSDELARMTIDKGHEVAPNRIITSATSYKQRGDYASFQRPFIYSAELFGDRLVLRFTGLWTINDYGKESGWSRYVSIYSNQAAADRWALNAIFYQNPAVAPERITNDISAPVFSVSAQALGISALSDFDTKSITITNAETQIFTPENGVRSCTFNIK